MGLGTEVGLQEEKREEETSSTAYDKPPGVTRPYIMAGNQEEGTLRKLVFYFLSH